MATREVVAWKHASSVVVSLGRPLMDLLMVVLVDETRSHKRRRKRFFKPCLCPNILPQKLALLLAFLDLGHSAKLYQKHQESIFDTKANREKRTKGHDSEKGPDGEGDEDHEARRNDVENEIDAVKTPN